MKGAVFLLVIFYVQEVFLRETVDHGPHVPHKSEDGTHNQQYDHQAVLGSEDLEEEFDRLSPEESRSRLKKLVESHDKDQDGYITRQELIDWIVASFLNLDREESFQTFSEQDENNDGKLTWEEYLRKVFGNSLEEVDQMRKTVAEGQSGDPEVEETKNILQVIDQDIQFFQTADEDGDNALTFEENMVFSFPANYPKMQDLELKR